MSNLNVTNYLEPSAADQWSVSCCNSTALKISLVILGLALVGGAIASYIYQVNTIAVYTIGTVGGFLILAATLVI